MTLAEASASPKPTGPAHTGPAVMIGGPVIPAPLLAAKVAAGATIRMVIHPGDAPPEPHYRPSTTLSRFVRCRDMTCRFPGCKEPADVCDLDHTIAYPLGPTCASNLKCLCRKNHLLKTFGRWRDQQLPDGTVIWTDPSGQTHTTRPGSYALFPNCADPPRPLFYPLPPNRRPTDRSVANWPCHAAVAPAHKTAPRGSKPNGASTRRSPQPRQLFDTPAPAPAENFASWLATLPPGDGSPAPF